MWKIVVFLLLVAAPVAAQPIVPPIPIHGHPQLKAYTDQSQLPTIAGHMNWGPGENPVASATGNDGVFDIVAGRIGNSQLGHGHMSLIKCPIYAEIRAPLSCRFQILLFNVQAQAIVNPAFQDGIRDLVWDATGTSTPPEMKGALGEERTWNGTLTFDPTLARLSQRTTHGWWNPEFAAQFFFDNGDPVNKTLHPSFYVLTDPSAPERPGNPAVSVSVSPHSARIDEAWGEQDVETSRGKVVYLPLAPITAPYTIEFNDDGYGATGLPPATTELRCDADIHHHMPGRVLQEIIKTGVHYLNAVLDPVSLGPGTHKCIVGRRQVGLSGIEAVVSQLVFDVKVGAAPPPVMITVPNVVGKPQTVAIAELMAAGILVDPNAITPQESTLPSGTVISQTPTAAAVVATGSSGALLVARQIVAPPPPLFTVEVVNGVLKFCVAGNCAEFVKKP